MKYLLKYTLAVIAFLSLAGCYQSSRVTNYSDYYSGGVSTPKLATYTIDGPEGAAREEVIDAILERRTAKVLADTSYLAGKNVAPM